MQPLADTDRVAVPQTPPVVAPAAGDPRFPATPDAPSGSSPTTFSESAAPSVPTHRRRRRTRQPFRWLIGVALVAVLAPPLLGISLVTAIYWQARTDQTRPVDAIVVLGTAQFNGRPGPVLRARLDRGLEVYQAGHAPLIVVTGGRQPGDQFTEAEAAQAYLIERGVPPDAILVEDRSHDSWQSMRGVAALLGQRGLNRVLLVSDGFHLFRLKKMAHDVGLIAYASAATDSPIRRGGPAEFGYVLREAAGVAVHVWRTR